MTRGKGGRNRPCPVLLTRVTVTERCRRWPRARSMSWSSAAASPGGAALDAASRGLRVGLVESRDLAPARPRGHQADPRRAAVPGAGSTSSWSGRHCGNATCWSPGSRRTWSGRCRSSTRCTRRSWSGPTSAPGWSLRRDGGRQAPGPAPPAPDHAGRAAPGARAAARQAGRRDALLRRAGGRRPVHDHRGADGGRRTALSCLPGRPPCRCCATVSRVAGGDRVRARRPGASSTCWPPG